MSKHTVVGFEPINLDGFADPDDYVALAEVFRKYREYCKNKLIAMQERRIGYIELAINHEQYCQRLYNQLPEWARW